MRQITPPIISWGEPWPEIVPEPFLMVNPDVELLREPNLLVPGKKPVGPVKLDQNHPLTKNIVHCFLDLEQDLATGKRATVASLYSTSPPVIPKVVRSDGDLWNQIDKTIYTYFSISADKWNDQKGTILFELQNASTSNTDCLLYKYDNSSSGPTRVYTGLVYDSFICLTTRALNSITPSITVTEPGVYIITSEAYSNNHKFYEGLPLGEISLTAQATRSGFALPTSGLGTIGAWGVNTSDWVGWIKHVYIFNRVLSPNELNRLNKDPYQFLIPA